MGTLNVRRLAGSRVVRGVGAAVLLAFVPEVPNAQFFSARDPGVRGGAASAGHALGGLTGGQNNLFAEGRAAFVEVNSVKGGDVAGEDTEPGLGPRFNSDNCGSCHSHPDVGGTAPPRNPQIAV